MVRVFLRGWKNEGKKEEKKKKVTKREPGWKHKKMMKNSSGAKADISRGCLNGKSASKAIDWTICQRPVAVM